MTHALHLSERTDWQTPEDVLDLVRLVGPIVLDPCSALSNPTAALMFYARRSPPSTPLMVRGGVWMGQDGLAAILPTIGLSFWNPPYGRHLGGAIDPFAEIVHKGEVIGHGTGWGLKWAQHDGERIALVPNRTETDWWGTMSDACDLLCFPDHRIPFVNPDTGEVGKQPNHGSTFFYAGPQPEVFRHVFEAIGRVYVGGSSCRVQHAS